ncbi:MAG: nitrogen permease regulator 3 [Bacteroides sp.]|nr:nitrogen permease regulator 3 [Eubacterium sp.]MCM1417723.1 nitrogen permease regulator 3 [Roseburia sp.]MCM1463517.1 nitrogen permease regulator 3 [Bacteroides sp.]
MANTKYVTLENLGLNNELMRKYSDANDETIKALIDAVSAQIDVLNGDGEGSVNKTVTDEIAKIVADAPDSLNTLKELSDWITTHTSDAAAMNTAIAENKTAVETLNEKVEALEAADLPVATEDDIRGLWATTDPGEDNSPETATE